MRAIITRGLYTFYLILKAKNIYLMSIFCKILKLCTVSIQECASSLKSRASYNGARTVKIEPFSDIYYGCPLYVLVLPY